MAGRTLKRKGAPGPPGPGKTNTKVEAVNTVQAVNAVEVDNEDNEVSVSPFAFECPICAVDHGHRVDTPCGHTMCYVCLGKLTVSTTGIRPCPYCRKHIDEERITIVVDDFAVSFR